MSRKDSLGSKYKLLNLISIAKKILFFLVVAETVLSIWFSNNLWFVILCISVVCLFFFASFTFEYYNYYIEKLRIVNTVELGFGKEIDSNVETDGYYNNEFKNGLHRLNLNIFESVFFTKKVFERHILLKYVSYIIFVAAFIVSIIVAPFNVAYIICEIVFSCGIAYEIYKTILFHVEINRLFNCFDSIFISGNYGKQKEALLAYTYQYEKLKSYISLSLNSKTFQRMNEQLSVEWKQYIDKIPKTK